MMILRALGWFVAFLILLALASISGLATLLIKVGKRLENWADKLLWQWGI